jgi:hypothetical protein
MIDIGTLIAGGAMLVAAITAYVNLHRWMQEKRANDTRLRDQVIRAEAERDSIVVKGAEGALLVMEKMLQVATESEQKFRAKVVELELIVEQQTTEIRELRRTNREQATRIDELERRLSNVERGES